jgi:hypothetical protein
MIWLGGATSRPSTTYVKHGCRFRPLPPVHPEADFGSLFRPARARPGLFSPARVPSSYQTLADGPDPVASARAFSGRPAFARTPEAVASAACFAPHASSPPCFYPLVFSQQIMKLRRSAPALRRPVPEMPAVFPPAPHGCRELEHGGSCSGATKGRDFPPSFPAARVGDLRHAPTARTG